MAPTLGQMLRALDKLGNPQLAALEKAIKDEWTRRATPGSEPAKLYTEGELKSAQSKHLTITPRTARLPESVHRQLRPEEQWYTHERIGLPSGISMLSEDVIFLMNLARREMRQASIEAWTDRRDIDIAGKALDQLLNNIDNVVASDSQKTLVNRLLALAEFVTGDRSLPRLQGALADRFMTLESTVDRVMNLYKRVVPGYELYVSEEKKSQYLEHSQALQDLIRVLPQDLDGFDWRKMKEIETRLKDIAKRNPEVEAATLAMLYKIGDQNRTPRYRAMTRVMLDALREAQRQLKIDVDKPSLDRGQGDEICQRAMAILQTLYTRSPNEAGRYQAAITILKDAGRQYRHGLIMRSRASYESESQDGFDWEGI